MVHCLADYLDQGRTINSAYYAGKFRRQYEMAIKRQGKLTHSVLLLLENAPAHMSQGAMTAVTECGFEMFPHSPFSCYGSF